MNVKEENMHGDVLSESQLAKKKKKGKRQKLQESEESESLSDIQNNTFSDTKASDEEEKKSEKKQKMFASGENESYTTDVQTIQNQILSETEGVKKVKKKKDKKKRKDKEKSESDTSSKKMSPCEYLRLWHFEREVWKFNKRLQIMLLKSMYDEDKVNDEDFVILLLYLDKLEGKARVLTMEQAESILKEEDSDDDEVKQERAKQIFQLLS